RLVFMEHEVVGLVETDIESTGQAEYVPGTRLLHDWFDRVGVNGVGPLAREAEQDGLVRCVSPAGQCQRPIQVCTYRTYLIEKALRLEHPDEAQRCPHRADRVRARRPDADLEQVKDTQCHQCSS